MDTESDACYQKVNEVQHSNIEIFEKCSALTTLTTPHTLGETQATADQKLLFLDVHNVLGQYNETPGEDQTEGGINTETKDGKGQILHCNYCDYSSKVLQRLNAHAFRHKENSPKNDAMGINITGLDEVHVETAKGSDTLSIHR